MDTDMAASMVDALPNEIWAHILDDLSKKDLKVLRLTGDQSFITLASSLLFTTAFVAARRRVFRAFSDLTGHPVLRNYIKTIIFDSSWIGPEVLSELEKETCGPEVTAMYAEQEKIQKSELQTVLENAFLHLSHIQKVIYADLSGVACLPSEKVDAAWECEDPDQLAITKRILSGHGKTMDVCCLHMGMDCQDHRDVFRREHGGFLLLMQALSKSPSQLKELSLGDRHHSGSCYPPNELRYGGMPYLFFITLPGSLSSKLSMPTLRTVFHQLRRLDLTISFATMGLASPSLNMTGTPARSQIPSFDDLKGFLATLENIEEIRLNGDPTTTSLGIGNAIPDVTWEKLRTLQLKHFQAQYSELTNLLRRHKHCLRMILLDEFYLLGRSWSKIFSFHRLEISHVDLHLGILWRSRSSDQHEASQYTMSRANLPNDDPSDESYHLEGNRCPGDPTPYEDSTSEELEYDSGTETCSLSD